MRVAEEESQLDRIERKLDELLHILGVLNRSLTTSSYDWSKPYLA
jgi:hypothetical protein